MESTIIFILLSISTCFFYFLNSLSRRRKSGVITRLPPGPYPFPIIGNILKLGNKPHHSLAALSKTYGPLMSLKLGTTTTIVVSSREIAQEFFLKHDVSFSSRSIPHVVNTHDHDKLSMAWLPVGDQWRKLRRISKEHLFVVRQLDASHLLRKEKVQQLVDHVQGYCDNGKPVNIGQTAATTTLNVLSNFIFSIDLAQYDSRSSQDFKDLVWSLMEVGGKPNIADFFPDLFIAGTETTSSTLEWAMAELIHNPEQMSKARSELEEVIGKEDRTFQESDISRLPYLHAIVKETLRLHPPVTFLLPHKATKDVEIQGYIIPKDTQILCNLWGMGQDSNTWSDAQRFKPQRFLDVGIDYKGRDLELIPFGTGRRICPGLPLAHRMLHLMLGSLIYKFDWKIEEGMVMDMSDKFGMTLQKNLPLMAIPVKL
ncbi:cytochrome P450 [Cynara cardunculus var. scolymus]|uniref:Cytochrome P450 n=1 Tax=Cynara cardunculus var. scolymus TaxID=59895 RepID=A0A103XBR0_CYNCS|nr:cytochrome P450 [Cynara cardunculus var. scolymus]